MVFVNIIRVDSCNSWSIKKKFVYIILFSFLVLVFVYIIRADLSDSCSFFFGFSTLNFPINQARLGATNQ